VYNLRREQNIISKIDKAFCTGDVKTLQTIESHTIQNVNSFYINNFNFENEDDIIDKFTLAFSAYYKKSSDLPIYVCFCCHKLCFHREVITIMNIKTSVNNEIWNNLLELVSTYGFQMNLFANIV